MTNIVRMIRSFYIQCKYKVVVKNYLTYADIQTIVDGLKEVPSNWASKNQHIDMMLLYFATGIDCKKLAEVGHDKLLESGFIDAVKKQIVNIDELYKAVEYTESAGRILYEITKDMSKYLAPLEKVVSKYENKQGKE